MTKQKIIVLGSYGHESDLVREINNSVTPWFKEGYLVKSITPLAISVATNDHSSGDVITKHGRSIVLMEKEE